ncbi:hypothetical protein PoB_004475500 [Plakobranchus ocellatus]|uniref:Uncharacterized protein n=1 Tax=Plakobranchus ocellatus TaxID=259542 RepID=A0AAV4BCA3_9GAST|nr:hypothetical protein PoB_004475500 [Plakobranchus ocellatus]
MQVFRLVFAHLCCFLLIADIVEGVESFEGVENFDSVEGVKALEKSSFLDSYLVNSKENFYLDPSLSRELGLKFHLRLNEKQHTIDGKQYYGVEVSSKDKKTFIDSVRIGIKAKGTCGAGTLYARGVDFDIHSSNCTKCPQIILTSRNHGNRTSKSPYLAWQPPVCGCVEFR